MLSELIRTLVVGLCVSVVEVIRSACAIVVALLGPGALWSLVAFAALWYLGWIDHLWDAAASYF
jgi:hypothetical protein